MEASVFTKIINRQLPAEIVYEDSDVIAFLTIEPFVEGHTLVVPKKQVDKFYELDDELYEKLFKTVKTLSIHLEKTLQAERVVEQIYGFDVPHVHIHLIPIANNLDLYRKSVMAQMQHTPPPYAPTAEELTATRKKLELTKES